MFLDKQWQIFERENDAKTIRDFISKLHGEEPACLETGVLFYIMKPGIYKFRATKTGNDKESSLEVKSGMCLRYRLK